MGHRPYNIAHQGASAPPGASDPLRQRLTDPAYSKAYYPNDYVTMGQPKSLAHAMSWFAGRGDGTLADGEAVIDQMLVNIIEYNPIEGLPFVKSDENRLNDFAAHWAREGVTVTVRRSRGKDIDAACGQLANKE